jgi:hypothetical protein
MLLKNKGNWTISSIMLTAMIGGRKRDELDVNKNIIRAVEVDRTSPACLLFKMIKIPTSWRDGATNPSRLFSPISSILDLAQLPPRPRYHAYPLATVVLPVPILEYN